MEDTKMNFNGLGIKDDRTSNHPRMIQAKFKANGPCQAERRAKLLEWRKQMRYDYVGHLRRLAENDWSLDDEHKAKSPMEEELKLHVEEMEWMTPYCKPPRFYRNQLMMSEWFIEIPNDLASEWLFVMCPVGKRCLVVASKGKTIAYTKSGYRVNTFPSNLPGGNRHHHQNFSSGHYTILDCIFNIDSKAFYILDVLCWKGHPVIDSETEFRFYWLLSKMAEHPELEEASKENSYRFLPLQSYACSNDNLSKVLASVLQFDPVPLDGVLFYHKRSHYLHGISPLVGWLKPYMIQEMLNIDVPELYAIKPKNYTCITEYLKVAFAKKNSAKMNVDAENLEEEEIN
ncbi:hypothetical protein CHUAL_013996 [Chamberlinius hualienensis]